MVLRPRGETWPSAALPLRASPSIHSPLHRKPTTSSKLTQQPSENFASPSSTVTVKFTTISVLEFPEKTAWHETFTKPQLLNQPERTDRFSTSWCRWMRSVHRNWRTLSSTLQNVHLHCGSTPEYERERIQAWCSWIFDVLIKYWTYPIGKTFNVIISLVTNGQAKSSVYHWNKGTVVFPIFIFCFVVSALTTKCQARQRRFPDMTVRKLNTKTTSIVVLCDWQKIRKQARGDWGSPEVSQNIEIACAHMDVACRGKMTFESISASLRLHWSGTCFHPANTFTFLFSLLLSMNQRQIR